MEVSYCPLCAWFHVFPWIFPLTYPSSYSGNENGHLTCSKHDENIIWQRFDKNISKLRICGNIISDKGTYSHFLLYKMKIKLNMFRTSLKHWINGHVQSTNIVTKYLWWLREVIQVNLTVEKAKEKYSALVFEQATVDCFFEHQEI